RVQAARRRVRVPRRLLRVRPAGGLRRRVARVPGRPPRGRRVQVRRRPAVRVGPVHVARRPVRRARRGGGADQALHAEHGRRPVRLPVLEPVVAHDVHVHVGQLHRRHRLRLPRAVPRRRLQGRERLLPVPAPVPAQPGHLRARHRRCGPGAHHHRRVRVLPLLRLLPPHAPQAPGDEEPAAARARRPPGPAPAVALCSAPARPRLGRSRALQWPSHASGRLSGPAAAAAAAPSPEIALGKPAGSSRQLPAPAALPYARSIPRPRAVSGADRLDGPELLPHAHSISDGRHSRLSTTGRVL
ncbi:hypothetical protein H4S02_010884, partial [Coemansia sp. RSA 2611]